MRKLRKFIRDRRGVTAIIVALSMPVIAGFAALGLDVGYMVLLQARLQAAGDAVQIGGGADIIALVR